MAKVKFTVEANIDEMSGRVYTWRIVGYKERLRDSGTDLNIDRDGVGKTGIMLLIKRLL